MIFPGSKGLLMSGGWIQKESLKKECILELFEP